jgi:hypothetical protein
LGGSFYTALVIALAEVEKSHQCTMSGFYGYKLPELEGIGLFTIQNNHFRLFFLCEGLLGNCIPYLGGKTIVDKLKNVFNNLEHVFPEDSCSLIHKKEQSSFWFDLMYSAGFGINIPVQEVKTLYPLRIARMTTGPASHNMINITKLESEELGTLGQSWSDSTLRVDKKIQRIFSEPELSFLIYKALFHQITEFVPSLKPGAILLTYQGSSLQENIELVSIISYKNEELNIRYYIPVGEGVEIDGSQSIKSCLHSLIIEDIFQG